MSLRSRLIGLLVAAIVAVVVLVAGATALVMDGPDDGMRARSAAEAIGAIARLVDGSPERARNAGLTLSPPPSPASQMPTPRARSSRRCARSEARFQPWWKRRASERGRWPFRSRRLCGRA